MNREKLPDVLREGLDVVFVGTAAGHRSAEQRAYYAHPGNKLWRVLHDIGLTPRQFNPSEYREVLACGIGFTDLCKTQSGGDDLITDYNVRAFERKIRKYRPRAIAFTSKKGGSLFLGCGTGRIVCGQQESRDADFPRVFVLPSPSGKAAGYWDIAPWRALAEWLRKQKR